MNIILSDIEVRILGCLIEKEATTPDVYPLTMNSLVSACNQKSNRDPVMELPEEEVTAAVNSLIDKTLVSIYQSSRNRMPKYQHKLRFRAFDEFNFSLPQLAVIGVLFLRGPQTLGEIRTRCARVHEFADLDAVIATLTQLEQHADGPYAKMLPRQAGRKEPRYAHLFSGEVEVADVIVGESQSARSTSQSRLQELETEVVELRAKLLELEQRFSEFTQQFE